MVFNNESEIRAFYAGRREEADRWAWWENDVKWCGMSDVVALQDVLTELDKMERDDIVRCRQNRGASLYMDVSASTGKYYLHNGKIDPMETLYFVENQNDLRNCSPTWFVDREKAVSAALAQGYFVETSRD